MLNVATSSHQQDEIDHDCIRIRREMAENELVSVDVEVDIV